MNPEKVTIGNAELWLGDCREVLPILGKVDAVVTDPPYGIGEAAGKNASRVKGRGRFSGVNVKDYGVASWDDQTIDWDIIQKLMHMSSWQIVFGGNYYPFPPSSCWLIWDKLNGKSHFADCELAWTNLHKSVRILRLLWNGFMRSERHTPREHPTQKPVGVMEWCLSHLPNTANTILDPLMGSGTTGVACANLGRRFIGVEIEPKYFEMACRRIERAQAQGSLFQDEPQEKKGNQEEFAMIVAAEDGE